MTGQTANKTDETETRSSETQHSAARKAAAANDWDAIRQSWLKPTKTDHPPSSSSSSSTGRAAAAPHKRVRRLEKVDQMLADYDQASRLGHPNPKPMLRVIDFADRLTNQANGHPAPIPLSQAVPMLYRSWFHDGTIPDSFPFHLQKMKDANDTEQEQ